MGLAVIPRIALAALAFTGFALGAPIVGLLLPILWHWGGSTLERRKRCQRAVGYSFRCFHAFMRIGGLIRFHPELRMPPSPRSRMVVANHPSLVDVTAILASQPELCCVVKPAVYQNPLYALIMRYCGHISSNPSGNREGDVGQAIQQRLEEGSDVLIFPEGTRTPGDEIGAFQAGGFGLAILCGSPIVPLAISCSEPVLKRGAPWYLVPARSVTLQLVALPPVYSFDGESSRDFAARVRISLVRFLEPQHHDPISQSTATKP